MAVMKKFVEIDENGVSEDGFIIDKNCRGNFYKDDIQGLWLVIQGFVGVSKDIIYANKGTTTLIKVKECDRN